MGLFEKFFTGKHPSATSPETRSSGEFLTGKRAKKIAESTVAVGAAAVVGATGAVANAQDTKVPTTLDETNTPPGKELHLKQPDDAVSHFQKQGVISGKVADKVDQAMKEAAKEQRRKYDEQALRNAEAVSESFGGQSENHNTPDPQSPPLGYRPVHNKKDGSLSFVLKTGKDYEQEGKPVEYRPLRTENKPTPTIHPDKRKHKPTKSTEKEFLFDNLNQPKTPPHMEEDKLSWENSETPNPNPENNEHRWINPDTKQPTGPRGKGEWVRPDEQSREDAPQSDSEPPNDNQQKKKELPNYDMPLIQELPEQNNDPRVADANTNTLITSHNRPLEVGGKVHWERLAPQEKNTPANKPPKLDVAPEPEKDGAPKNNTKEKYPPNKNNEMGDITMSYTKNETTGQETKEQEQLTPAQKEQKRERRKWEEDTGIIMTAETGENSTHARDFKELIKTVESIGLTTKDIAVLMGVLAASLSTIQQAEAMPGGNLDYLSQELNSNNAYENKLSPRESQKSQAKALYFQYIQENIRRSNRNLPPQTLRGFAKQQHLDEDTYKLLLKEAKRIKSNAPSNGNFQKPSSPRPPRDFNMQFSTPPSRPQINNNELNNDEWRDDGSGGVIYTGPTEKNSTFEGSNVPGNVNAGGISYDGQ
jgi:hypothetical protein